MVLVHVLHDLGHLLRVHELERGEADRDLLQAELLHRFHDVLHALGHHCGRLELIAGAQDYHHGLLVLQGLFYIRVVLHIAVDDL